MFKNKLNKSGSLMKLFLCLKRGKNINLLPLEILTYVVYKCGNE